MLASGTSSDAENAEESPRNGRTARDPPDAVELLRRETAGRRKPALVRSKTFDPSLLTRVQTDPDSKIERKKSHYSLLSKSNCQYHKIFKEICKEEQLRQSYTCALQKDILYQGRMFVSDHWICFHSKVFGKDTKIAIPVVSVTNVKKTNTAILLPNALVVATANDRYVFVSFMSRDNTYKFLMSSCLHLEVGPTFTMRTSSGRTVDFLHGLVNHMNSGTRDDEEKSPCSSPVPSSRSPQRSPLTPRYALSFPADFCELDVAVRKRRRDVEDSSSSDSQTLDYDKAAEYPDPLPDHQRVKTQNQTQTQTQTQTQNQYQNQNQYMNQNQQSSDNKQQDKQQTALAMDGKTLKPVSLNTMLSVYLLLVCVLVLSSCYLAYKIVSLEQRLTMLGSITESAPQESDFLLGSEVNMELFSELLTINLMKLEKVQKNLQRLLDEAS